MVVAKTNLEDILFKRELNINDFKGPKQLNVDYDSMINFVVDTVVYYADRGNESLLDQPLYYFGIPSKSKVKDVLNRYDVAPLKDYIDPINNIIKKYNLPFRIVGNKEEGWKLMYLDKIDDLNNELDELSTKLLEEEPDALYGLNNKYENGILIDKDGNVITPTKEEVVDDKPKPKKWKKLVAIGAAAVMVGAAASYFMYHENPKPKIESANIKIVPHTISGMPPNDYSAEWKSIDIALNATSPDGFEKIIIYYGEFERVNQIEPKSNFEKVKAINWIPYKKINLKNGSFLGGYAAIVKNKMSFCYSNNGDIIAATLYEKEASELKLYTLIKISIFDKKGDVSSKEYLVRNWDIAPQITSQKMIGNKLEVTISDPDNIGNYFLYYPNGGTPSLDGTLKFSTVEKTGAATYLAIIDNPSSKIKQNGVIVIDSAEVDSCDNAWFSV